MIYQEGLSNLNLKSRGINTSYGRGGYRFGTSAGKISGNQQTILSERAVPPAKRRCSSMIITDSKSVNLIIWTCFIFSIIFAIVDAHYYTVAYILIAIVAAALYYNTYKYNKYVWPVLYNRWDKSFMCSQCENVFIIQ